VASTTNAQVSEARHHKIVSNIFSNWATSLVGMVVGFLLAPVMVHRLGDAGYGVWTFSLQVSSLLIVMDLGVRSSVGRFLTYHHTRGEKEQINAVLSVAFAALGGLGALCVVASLFISIFLQHIVKVQPAMLHDARWTVLLVSWTVAVSLPGSIFAGAIASLSRYDILNLRYVLHGLIRALLTWLVLVHGGGIVAISIVWLLTAVVAILCDVLIATKLYRGFELRFDLRKYKSVARSLLSFSFYVFLLSISVRLVLWSDNIVIAVILGPASVTFYAIGGNLIDVARGTLSSMTTVYVPLATSYQAKGDSLALRQLFVRGSRVGLLILLPVVIAFLIVGKEFIGLWMGPQYVMVAGTVLMLLAIPVLFAPLQMTSNQLLYGVNRHQVYAYIAVVEAAVNLGLSIILARTIGVVGVAWGTMIPAVIIEGLIVPSYTAGVLKQPVLPLYWRAWIGPVALSLPYATWLFVSHHIGWPITWPGFVLTITTGLLIYALTTWFFTLSESERQTVVVRFKQVIPAPARSGV
jgi:O-antigen/teichoic acid export membrane protein